MRLVKIFLVISILLFSPLRGVRESFAQTYSALWKQYEKAIEKDLPKSAISCLSQIEKKAVSEKSYGNMMAAWIKELSLQQEISPDSLNAARKRLKSKQEGLLKQDGVASTLLDIALKKSQFIEQGGVIDSLLHSTDSILYVTPNKDASYAPFCETGTDSKYFNHDLLHLIGFELNDLEPMKRYYLSVGNEKAVAILDARIFMQNYRLSDEEKMHYIDSTLARWQGWNAMDMLRQIRNDMTTPSLFFNINKLPAFSSDSIKICFNSVRNVSSVKVKISRVNISRDIFFSNDEQEKIKTAKSSIVKGCQVTASKMFAPHKAYEFLRDTITLAPLAIGFYLVEASCDNGKIPVQECLISVSNLRIISIQSADEMRFVVVDAATGHPVPGAKLHIKPTQKGAKEQVVTTNADGEYTYTNANVRVWASTVKDQFFTDEHSNFRKTKQTQTGETKHDHLFTDRSIYRPGQTVHTAVVAYTVSSNQTTTVRPNAKVVITVRNPLGKVERKDTLTTDEYGTAAYDFYIAEGSRNGNYNICSEHDIASIKVEEYARPTFNAEINKPTIAYHNGDTISVVGKATTYSGIPVANARVTYTVKRRPSFWLRNISYTPSFVNYHPFSVELLRDTIETSADGTFQMHIPMVMPTGQNKWQSYFYDIFTEATVTDITGESHSASISLPLSNREAFLSCDMEDKILADSSVTTTIERRNIAGEKIQGTVSVTIDGIKKGDYEANTPILLCDNLASGKHTMQAICGGDTITHNFVVFRISDTHPATETKDWWYQTAKRFDENGEIAVQFGTCDRNIRAYYSLYAGSRLIEQGQLDLDSTLCTRHFSYKEEYGNGLTYAVAWVRNGKTYTHSAQMMRPLPDIKLKMQWSTFRDKVVPGGKEEWTLRITQPDGTPAKAQLLAALYDKSLDAIMPHNWHFGDYRNTALPVLGWHRGDSYTSCFGTARFEVPYKRYHDLQFSHLTDIFSFTTKRFLARPMMAKSANNIVIRGYSSMESAAVMDEVKMMAVDSNRGNEEETKQEESGIRNNLVETAFFYPQLRTDAHGIATISFTLPESVTTWHFLAFAHDRQMHNGILSDETIAQKELMVQPRMPRFLRDGDKGVIATSIANLSDKDDNVKVTMRFTEESTGKAITSMTKKVEVKAGATAAVEFAIDCSGLGGKMLLCTTTAVGNNYSDGEQHRLPVLSNMEEITSTFTFANRDNLSADSIVKVLTPKGASNVRTRIEKVDHPETMMLNTLPSVKDTKDNAIALISAYYANTLTAKMRHQESDSLKMLLTRLLILQNQDGSWSWWKGMEGSSYVTMYVAKTLLRLNSMVGEQSATHHLLVSSMSYLDNVAAKNVERMKGNEKKGQKPFVTTLLQDYLYCLTLLPSTPSMRITQKTKDCRDYLIKHLANDTRYDDMATKAKSAIVLNGNGRKKDAMGFIESIVQHTVTSKDMGRYFDSYRAVSSWCDYRIPTQVAAIEALKAVTPADTITTWDMQRWLLQSKRTQQWSNPVNTVNAVYAFCKGNGTSFDNRTAEQGWTNIFVTFEQRSDEVSNASTELHIEREISDATPKVGDRVKVTITITADRDFDLVSVTDNRAACLEPVSQLSGYAHGYYTELHDSNTQYYFDKLPKGTHRIVTEYFVTRQGQYQSGTATVQSTYAPEFCGRTKTITIKPITHKQ